MVDFRLNLFLKYENFCQLNDHFKVRNNAKLNTESAFENLVKTMKAYFIGRLA